MLGAPFFILEILQLDELHIVDLRVAQVFLGSAFKVLCGKLIGSFEQRCKALHGRMKFWYSVHQTRSRLDQLKPSMIQAQGKPFAKLTGKAGGTRASVPFCEQLCSELLNPKDPDETGLQICATAFQACYQQLSHTTYEPQTVARKARTFALASYTF